MAKRSPCTVAAVLLAATWLVEGPASQAGRQELRLRFPSFVGSARCQTMAGQEVERASIGLEQSVSCPGSGRMLRCDFASAEPVDTAVDAVCSTQSVEVHQARPVTVVAGEPRHTTVDWLNLTGGRAVVVASRTFGAAEITLPVAGIDNRAIRFGRDGYAPVTLVARQLLSADRWRLSDPRPGGEFVAVIEPATVVPTSFRLAGPSAASSMLEPTWNMLSASALPAGRYSLTPVYDGGVEGTAVSVQISPGVSTILHVPPQQLGALAIDLDPALCSKTDIVVVSRVTRNEDRSEGATRSTRSIARVERQAGCWVSVGGLQPGSYSVRFLSRGADISGSRDAEVVAQEVSTLQTAASGVVLSGRITAGGKPADGVTLELLPPGAREPIASATTDFNGWYSTTLEIAGRYAVRLRDRKSVILGQQKVLELKDGANAFDWAVEGGVVTVHLVGWDRKTPVELVLSAARFESKTVLETGSVRVLTTYAVDEHDAMPLDLRGIAFGEYAISAREVVLEGRQRRMSRQESITLSKDTPTAEVTLTLEARNLRAIVKDEDGNPVTGARFSVVKTSLVETEPGVYELTGVSPGSPIIVRSPGFSPTCRIAPDGAQLEVVAARGTEILLRFTGGSSWLPNPPPRGWIPGLVFLAEWGCAVPLEEWPFTLLPTSGAPLTFRVGSFPDPAGRVFIQLESGGPPIPITRSSDGGFAVALPPRRQ